MQPVSTALTCSCDQHVDPASCHWILGWNIQRFQLGNSVGDTAFWFVGSISNHSLTISKNFTITITTATWNKNLAIIRQIKMHLSAILNNEIGIIMNSPSRKRQDVARTKICFVNWSGSVLSKSTSPCMREIKNKMSNIGMLVVIELRRSNTSLRIKFALPTCALRFLSFQNLYNVLPKSTEKKRSNSATEHPTAPDIGGASPKLTNCRYQSPGPLGYPCSPRTMVVVTLAVHLSVANYS